MNYCKGEWIKIISGSLYWRTLMATLKSFLNSKKKQIPFIKNYIKNAKTFLFISKVDENIIGAPKIQNNYSAIPLFI